MEGKPPVLSVKGLTTQFIGRKNTSVTVVDGVDLLVRKGETLGIVGESGCGKSVTSLSIMRLLGKNGRVVSGQVEFEGADLLSLEEKEMRKIRGNQLAMIFQEPMTSLNPVLTIGRQIGEVLQLHTPLGWEERKKRTIELIAQVGIPRAQDIFGEYPHRLSGGMRQRVMIAMAMACQPQLLIADEPTTALDVTIQAQMLTLIRDIAQRQGCLSCSLLTIWVWWRRCAIGYSSCTLGRLSSRPMYVRCCAIRSIRIRWDGSGLFPIMREERSVCTPFPAMCLLLESGRRAVDLCPDARK